MCSSDNSFPTHVNSSPTDSPPRPSSPNLSEDQNNDADTSIFSEEAKATISSLQEPLIGSRSEEYRQLFHLPSEEVLLRDFNCAMQKNILLQGHMYIFIRYICFYSNIFGFEEKKIIPLRHITSVQKAKTAGLFPNAIEIDAWGKKHFFGSFLSRDEAYRLIVDGWMQHSDYAKLFFGLQNTGVSSPSPGSESSALVIEQISALEVLTAPESALSEEFQTLQSKNLKTLGFESRDFGKESTDNETTVDDNSVTVNELIPEASVPDVCTEELISQPDAESPYISWHVEDKEAPTLAEGYRMVAEAKFSMDVKDFFQLYFSDDARGFFADFHKKCKDEDFRCTQWRKDRQYGYCREVSFRHPVNLYFGSKFAQCQEVQRFQVYKNSHLVLETSQQMADVPYADSFRVEGRWDVEKLTDCDDTESILRIFVNVAFSKKVLWRGKIEQGTFEECKQVYSSWIADARALLIQHGGKFVKKADHKLSNLSISEAESGKEKQTTSIYTATTTNSERYVCTDKKTIEDGNISNTSYLIKSGGGKSFTESLKNNSIASSIQKVHSTFSFDWNFRNRLWLILLISFAAVFLLTQVTIISFLSKQQNFQHIKEVRHTKIEDTLLRLQEYNTREMAAWLEQRMFFLKQEMSLLESRIKGIHHEFQLLKLHLQLLDQTNSEKRHDVEL